MMVPFDGSVLHYIKLHSGIYSVQKKMSKWIDVKSEAEIAVSLVIP